MENLLPILEAIVFASENTVTTGELQDIFQRPEFSAFPQDEAQITALLEQIAARYQALDCGMELRNVAGGWQFYTKADLGTYVSAALAARDNKKLTKAALETLSIVAYRQPVTKAEMEFIRGVSCEYAVQKLLDRGLIEPAGRTDDPGRPLLYRTTPYFLEYFGLKNLEELPKLKELKTDEESIPESFRVPEPPPSQN